MKSLPPIPPLPADWPFAPRAQAQAPIPCGPDSLPRLGPGWSAFAIPQLPFGEEESMGASFGRGGVRRSGEVVIRPYRRGGLVRFFNERTYTTPLRFAREFAVHRALWLAGFPTVEPLGYAWKRRGWGFEGCFLTRFTECEPWPRHWNPEALPELRRQIEALCDWGLHAPDLNATNVMVGTESVLLLDWDRAAWGGSGLFPKYRSRLVRSLEKLGAPETLRKAVGTW